MLEKPGSSLAGVTEAQAFEERPQDWHSLQTDSNFRFRTQRAIVPMGFEAVGKLSHQQQLTVVWRADCGWLQSGLGLSSSLPLSLGSPSTPGWLPAPTCGWASETAATSLGGASGGGAFSLREPFLAQQPTLTHKAVPSCLRGHWETWTLSRHRGTFHTRHATTRAERAWHSPTEEREIDQERGSWKRPENVSVPCTFTEFYLQERDVPQGEKKSILSVGV